MAFSRWPEEDKRAWIEATAEAEFLEEPGPASRWAERTKVTNTHHYGRWLAYLDSHGLLVGALAERCNHETVADYVRWLRESGCSSVSLTSSIYGLASMLRALAPAIDWVWLQQIGNTLKANQRPTRNKASRIIPSDEIYARAIWKLRLLVESGLKGRHDFVHFRNALMIALLAAVPLRRRNFANLELDRNLLRNSDGWLVDIPASETKNNDPMVIELPRSLVRFVNFYVDDVRSTLLNGKSTAAIWINHRGDPMNEHAVYLRLIKATRRMFGRSLNPHLFRDCAATTLAGLSPDNVEVARDLLGHGDARMTEEHYIHAHQRLASRASNALIFAKLGLRAASRAAVTIPRVPNPQIQRDHEEP